MAVKYVLFFVLSTNKYQRYIPEQLQNYVCTVWCRKK